MNRDSRRGRSLGLIGTGVLLLLLAAPTAVMAKGPASGGGGGNTGASAQPVSTGLSNHKTPGDSNPEDVWVDNVGQPPGPGHEMDPMLACANINLWGTGLGDASGIYTIDGWAPTGSGHGDYGHNGYQQDQAWPGTKADPGTAQWNYNTTEGGTQIISVILVKTLIADAQANGDTPVNGHGYHFKLQFVQDPQKHKTFWVNCPAPSGSGSPTPKPSGSGSPTPKPSGSGSPTPKPSGSGSPTPKPSGNGAPTPSPSASGSPTPSPAGGVHGASTGGSGSGGVLAASTPGTGANLNVWLTALLLLAGLSLIGYGVATRMRSHIRP